MRTVDDFDFARSQEYALLATLLTRSPDGDLLGRISALRGDASPMGVAHNALAEAARRTNEQAAAREFFALFAGLGKGALLPYASHYLSETLYGRPLARLRETLGDLGLEKAPERAEPEDHAGFLCEIMAGFAGGTIPAPAPLERLFFEEHVSRWMRRFFADLEQANSADFYAAVGGLGRTFIEIEVKAFALPI
ncbi:TorD/DmsD family molecular chaperone [Bradyrhizobium cosmicum]|uniref:TorD/DmsD family molecular chaperone n=1 Tax=Bradyrhizobium cosmicum TaxID=1404864 RepID=UPI0011658459|nr:molecular chaperone TorD family protein [Bradyrhizobium cosmicum]QDP21968.1 molecular chaperone TorD family protein [Bradyrhizobium cosmicum]